MAGSIELKGDDGDDPIASVTKALGTLSETVETRIKAIETKADTSALVARLDGLEAKLNRPGGGEDKQEPGEELKAFGVYLRHGKDHPDLDLKTLRVSSDPQGGYLAPPEFSAEFLKEITQFSPIRSIASVRTTSAPSVIYPSRTAITNAAWRGENQTQTASEPTFGEAEIPVRELNTFVDISNILLADSGGAADREVREALAEDFGAKEAAAFANGDGVLSPTGFLRDARILETVSLAATTVTADALINILYALPPAYRANATWLMNSTTLASIRKLKDGQNNYLWQPSIQAGQPETILGRPVLDAIDMPDQAGGAYPVAVGDFNAGYRILDRVDMSILVNPFTRATEGVTRFHATRRVGGAVIRPLAIRKMKCSAT
jgi:HK97 family phage major capsid protein